MEEMVKKRFAISTSLFAALAAVAMMSTSQPAAQEAPASTAEHAVDFEFFKTRVEPIFLKKRPGHSRCYACHVAGEGRVGARSAFRLQRLSPGNTFWTEEQSRLNFQSASLLVVPGEPTSSRLLMHPIEREAGGDPFHGGGRQFASQNDPDWLTLAEWVRGKKDGASSEK
jgi:hypothetical protein